MVTGRLRNEDYVAFVDESGDDKLTVISGVMLPARWVRATEARWEAFLRSHGIYGRGELKAWKLTTGRGVAQDMAHRLQRPSGDSMSTHAKRCGQEAYIDALRLIGTFTELRVATVGVPTGRPIDAYRVWNWMLCAGLTTRPRSPRPRVPVIVIDGQDQGIRRALRGVVGDFYWRCNRRQPYVSAGKAWFIGGATLHDSATLPFIQMADLVAHAAYQAIKRKPERAFMHHWYGEHLLGTARARGREIDVSESMLQELSAINPKIGRYLLHDRAVLAR